MNSLDIGNLSKYFDGLSPEEKIIRILAFRRILEGRWSSIEDLAFETKLTELKVQKCVESLVNKGTMVLNENGQIVGSHGLSLTPTEHRLKIYGQDLFTWCAADAVGIPAALACEAMIESKCFNCKKPIMITMSNGKAKEANLKDIRIWVIEADLGRSIVGCA